MELLPPSCQTISEDDCLPMDQFAVHLLPHLLHLASDRVPNVRVLLAKTLKQTLLEKGEWWKGLHGLTACLCVPPLAYSQLERRSHIRCGWLLLVQSDLLVESIACGLRDHGSPVLREQ